MTRPRGQFGAAPRAPPPGQLGGQAQREQRGRKREQGVHSCPSCVSTFGAPLALTASARTASLRIRQGQYAEPAHAGQEVLVHPGPTPVPPEVLAAAAAPVIHHRGPDFKELLTRVLGRLKAVCRTEHDVLLFTASGTGAFESALVNLLSPGGAPARRHRR